MGCPFRASVILTQLPINDNELCWSISRVEGLDHGPCALLENDCRKLDTRIASIVPQGRLSEEVEIAIGKFVSKGSLSLRHIMGLLASDFPHVVTSETQVRNAMSKIQRETSELSCR